METEAIIDEPVLLIRINRLYHDFMEPLELYEATRGVWRVGYRRYGAAYALAVYKGRVLEVYRISSWEMAGTDIYETRSGDEVQIEGRYEFTGKPAPPSVREKSVGKSMKRYFRRGSSNPVTYVNC